MKWSGAFRVNGKKFEWMRSASTGSLDIFDSNGDKVGYAKSLVMAKRIAATCGTSD